MKQEFAPIILFVYSRLECTMSTIETLKRCVYADMSELFIFSDAPKSKKQRENVQKVRKYIYTVTGFKKVTIIEQNTNLGLSESIISGVTEIINKYGRVIVMEDDLNVNAYFLKYMNEALDKYENNQRVMSITGYSFSEIFSNKMEDTYFLPFPSSWTWATWKDKWVKFDRFAEGWETLKTDRELRKQFNFCRWTGFYEMMLFQMEKKSIDSWAIRWYWTVFQNKGLTLYPKVSLVSNDGYEGQGVHCRGVNDDIDIERKIEHIVLTDKVEVAEKNCSIVRLNLFYRKCRKLFQAGVAKIFG